MTDPNAPSELGLHLERQMRAQERQLVWVRLGTLAAAAAALLLLARDLPALPVLLGVLAAEALYTALVPFLVSRFPAREVGIVSTAVDMAAVTVAAYAASNVLDIYLFYGLVILAAALRFGFGAAVWSAVIMSGLYAVVVLVGSDVDALVRDLLPTRLAFLLGFGLVAGLFSRILIGRATENARLQQRLGEEERDRERRAEAEVLGRIGRDAAASLDRSATHLALVQGAAPVLGDATMLLTVDDATRRLTVEAADGRDAELVAAWRAAFESRRPRVGEGIAGAVAATAASRGGGTEAATGDPDALRAAGATWMYATPILAAGRLLGVLATASREPPEDGRVARLADMVAERAGPAVQNAELWADLQRRMAAEQAAQRVKDDFLSIVSHELRTPLTSIQGYSQLLEGRLNGERNTNAKELAHLRVIRSQVSRMRRLVDDLLDVSRIDRRGGVSIETADFDLAQEVRDAVARARREHPDRSIELEAPEALPVHADRDRMDQVLGNLIENAVKYSPDGGPIRVECERRGGEVEVRVTDQGIGIAPEHRDHVFERFYQADADVGGRRFGGLGLGLYITRAIIDAHGGRIWAAANPDGPGSVFGFRMPRIALEPATPAIVPTGEPPAFVLRHRDGGDG